MGRLFYLLFAFSSILCRAEDGVCPFGTLSFVETKNATLHGLGRRLCYVVLFFQEIKYIREKLWNDPKREGYWNYDGRNHVESYPDAVRMCQLVSEIRNDTGTGWITHFKAEWTRIPDEYELRLPTPRTEEHLKWLVDNVCIDPYGLTGGGWLPFTNMGPYYDAGRIWLDIKRSTSPLNQTWAPKKPAAHLHDKIDKGQCGYLYHAGGKADYATSTGLYWLPCDGRELGEDGARRHNGYNVACEFDAPRPCEQVVINTMCMFSKRHDSCMAAGYMTITEPNGFGQPCRDNWTAISDVPCHPNYTEQCKRDCEWGKWQDIGPCFVEAEEEVYNEKTGQMEKEMRKYICDEEEEYGKKIRWRPVKKLPRYGGACPGRNLKTVGCVCKGNNIETSWIVWIGLTAVWVYKTIAPNYAYV